MAIGPAACTVAAHLLNLQGLAIGETCSPSITHGIYEQTFVPRAILLDSSSSSHDASQVNQYEPDEEEMLRLSSSLAFHPNSRYRVPSKQKSPAYSSNGRHVNWDEEEEEHDKHDEDYESRKQEQQELDFNRQLQSAQEPMERYWEAQLKLNEQEIPFSRILMPPYRPDTICASPPRYNLGDVVQTYTTGQSEDCGNLWETVRKRLEECDSCQGVILSHSGGVDAGLATTVLREWKDECPNKSSLVIACENENECHSEPLVELNMNQYDATRSTMGGLLALYDHCDLADAVVPMKYQSSATAACTLETITLPFRLRRSPRAVTLLSSAVLYQDDFTGNLSFREFMRTLQRQSASRNILNISSLDHSADSLDDMLLAGTSIQRDLRMRQPGYAGGIHRGRDELPGEWLSEKSIEGGLMCSWLPVAPSNEHVGDRSLHYHFASSAAYRPTAKIAISDFSTCLQESLGIRYRPDRTAVSVVNESLADLSRNGYASASYWRGRANRPILATLDNSTRVYPNLHRSCLVTERVVAPRNRRSVDRSRYNQDVELGLLPELDDMKDALTALFDLRDSYTPPESSGLVFEDRDGEF